MREEELLPGAHEAGHGEDQNDDQDHQEHHQHRQHLHVDVTTNNNLKKLLQKLLHNNCNNN